MRITDLSDIELGIIRPLNGDARPPAMGEQTGNQSRSQGDLTSLISTMAGTAGTFAGVLSGFGPATPSGVQTYRMMRNNANVAIGRMTIQAPVKASNWSIETTDEAPADAEELVRSVIDHKVMLTEHALRMLDYGRSSFEIVWDTDESGAVLPSKFKPLLVDITTVLIDKKTGQYQGLKNGTSELLPANTLHMVFDGEAGDYYGRSLFENIRQWAWWPWIQTLNRSGRFGQKVAGSTLVVKYAPGQGRDANGAVTDNYDLAVKVANGFGRGDAVVVPMTFAPWAEDMIRQGVDPAKLMAWQLEFMEPATGHAAEFLETVRSYESNILRGLMVPERVVTEGKFGTKAESETQATIAIAFSEEIQSKIIDCINWYVVDRIMALNFGPEAVGTVFIKAEPLIDEKRSLIREMVKSVLGNPGNADLWQTMTDIDAQLEMVGLPKSPEGMAPMRMPEELVERMKRDAGMEPSDEQADDKN